jgi:NADPH:quinone reductase-like Zn-dependent oxidoreductase
MSNTVKAWGVSKAGGLDALQEFDIPKPKTERPRDLLVKVHAVALNPIDNKVRGGYDGAIPAPRILGWDAAGVVEAVGPEASMFKVGDEVYFAGDLTRQGSFSQYAVVDERYDIY